MSNIEKTREKIVDLVGPVKAVIDGRKLPTNRQVLQLFFYKHNVCHLTIRQSARESVEEVQKKWLQARIPTGGLQYCTSKVEKLHLTWINVRKSSKRKNSLTETAKVQNFQQSLDNLFDIAQRDVLNTLAESDKLFLISQRNSQRRGFLPASSSTSVLANSSSIRPFVEYRDIEDENTNDSVSSETSNSMVNSSSETLPGSTGEAHVEEPGTVANYSLFLELIQLLRTFDSYLTISLRFFTVFHFSTFPVFLLKVKTP